MPIPTKIASPASRTGAENYYMGKDTSDIIDTITYALKAQNTYHISVEGANYRAQKNDGTTWVNSNLATLLDNIKTDIGSGTGYIKFGAGNFDFASQFAWEKSNTILEGSGIGITVFRINLAGNLSGWRSAGTAASNQNLTANSLRGSRVVTVASTTGYVAGDLVYIRRNVVVDAGTTTRYDAELHRVASVDSGTQLTLDTYLLEDYNTADSASIYKITPVKNVTIRNLTFEDIRAAPASLDYAGDVQFEFFENFKVENVHFNSMFFGSLAIHNCFNVKLTNLHFESPQETAALDGIKYGLYILGATTNLEAVGISGNKCRHTITTNTASGTGTGSGRRRNLSFVNCMSYNADVAHFDTHQSDVGVSFTNCHAIGSFHPTSDANGFNLRSPTTMVNCVVQNWLGVAVTIWQDNNAAGTQDSPGGDKTVLIGCRFENGFPFSSVVTGIHVFTNKGLVIIDGCMFDRIQNDAIRFEGGNSSVAIVNTKFASCGTAYSSTGGIINLFNTNNDVRIANCDFGLVTTVNARPFIVQGAGVVNRLQFHGNNVNALTNKSPTISAASTDVDIRGNIGLNPIGNITNPINTTNNTIGFYGGSTGTAVASTDYTIVGCDCLITSTGGTGVSITIKDKAGTTIASGLATLAAQFVPRGAKINFGAFSAAPTLTVSGC